MTRRCGVAVAALFVLVMSAGLPARQEMDPQAVRARMHAYLSAYEKDLGTLVAEERLFQWPMRGGTVAVNGARIERRDVTRVRTLVSEVAFVTLPGAAGWLGYRDVHSVGGRSISRKGAPLEQLLKAQSDDVHERAMVLLLESARHNLGAPRTINLPSLPLELLHVRNQARFVTSAHEMDRSGDCDAMRLMFEETVRPTMIQRPEGGDMPSTVAAWVEPATGRLCRAEVRTRDGRLGVPQFTAIVNVAFARHAELGLTVPARMDEVFFIAPRGRGESEATYTNYRRFTTGARVVP